MGELRLVETVSFKTATCVTCGAYIVMTDGMYNQRRTDREVFYCPSGHQQYFSGETPEEKLKREYEAKLEQEKKRREWAEQSSEHSKKRAARLERKASAYRGVITKTRKRIANGACPCCNRTFQNLAAHMTTKHPQFKKKTK